MKKIKVRLDEILEAMEFQSDEIQSYLNLGTGKVVSISDEEFGAIEDNEPIEDFPQWQQENLKIAREILEETGNYLLLPSKFDIHEYKIMEDFCLSLEDEEIREIMYRSIKGSGAFRRFKDNIHRYGIADDWYEYRDRAFHEIAVEWCEANNLEYE